MSLKHKINRATASVELDTTRTSTGSAALFDSTNGLFIATFGQKGLQLSSGISGGPYKTKTDRRGRNRILVTNGSKTQRS